LTKDRSRLKNRIKSLLSYLGVTLPEHYEQRHWSNKFIEYLSGIEFEYEALNTTLKEFLSSLADARIQVCRVLKELREIVNKDVELSRIIRLLMSIPGLGFITAITFYSEILDIFRFASLDVLSSYVGLIPFCQSRGSRE